MCELRLNTLKLLNIGTPKITLGIVLTIAKQLKITSK